MWRSDQNFSPTLRQAPQLPVTAYFDEALLEREQQEIFGKLPRYAGHSLLVPSLYDYCVLPRHHNGLALVHGEQGVQLMSNVCRHRQATILQGRGNSKRLSCPMHRWTYDSSGVLVTAPKFSELPCLQLERFPTRAWNGLHFTGETNAIAELDDLPLSIKSLLEFDSCYFGHMEVHECKYNWKTFLEFYLEDYHVASFHPGLGHFVSCDELQWSFGANWSAQTVAFYKGLEQPGNSAIYRAWHQAVRTYYAEGLPPIGAMWLLIYPNVMIEWYPLVTVVSTIHPRGPERSVNVVEYYHPRGLRAFADGEAMASLAASAYLETAIEDNHIGERMQEGRFALMSRGASEYGPYQAKLEAGMEHFHGFLRDRLGRL
ncbi:aromatic ring-hydroxylating dioxygenase subunit alpha [uncultured Variovorax sp.]|uniref:aromatic ring-hydroxylating oxygenase subunit alpha n=1 Tax=uncultured Variovorax sp. TaxID=114708 RepID=UPI0025D21E89|nr:aromatic ring-hydroxylating dioxygenase subunit alpha [uncultured Variovorax sp.]